jgi:BCD family chlorophyll transporter-like MFS transporter
MGLWGAAQAISFGIGGFCGALASDVARSLIASQSIAYATVFCAEAILFLASAWLALFVVPRLTHHASETAETQSIPDERLGATR